jgi:hypothetical protein
MLSTFSTEHCLCRVYCNRKYRSFRDCVRFRILSYSVCHRNSINETCWMGISSSFLWKYRTSLCFIYECFVSRCYFNLFHTVSCYVTETQNTLRSFFVLNYNTRDAEREIRFIVLMRFRYTTTTTICCRFVWFHFTPVKKLCIILCFRKHHLLVDDTGL